VKVRLKSLKPLKSIYMSKKESAPKRAFSQVPAGQTIQQIGDKLMQDPKFAAAVKRAGKTAALISEATKKKPKQG
jgi:hypothetical protein